VLFVNHIGLRDRAKGAVVLDLQNLELSGVSEKCKLLQTEKFMTKRTKLIKHITESVCRESVFEEELKKEIHNF
tara:strand:- start:4616 stop:4837 length:222 start_codon:yes stop_codon:yes gene_type:complete